MKIEGEWNDKTWYGAVRIDGRMISPERSLKVYNHSPDGFSWGYGGSGPAQLALAILLEAGLSDQQALHFHQDFKWSFIANRGCDRKKLVLDVDVKAWINEHTRSGSREAR